MIEILRGLPAWQALWQRLDAAGWGDAAEPGRRTAFNGLGHAIWQMRQNPAEAESWCVVVLHAGLLDHGIRGLATYRELPDRLELEYMGAAQAGQGAGTVLLRYLAAEAAARHVPLTLRRRKGLGNREVEFPVLRADQEALPLVPVEDVGCLAPVLRIADSDSPLGEVRYFHAAGGTACPALEPAQLGEVGVRPPLLPLGVLRFFRCTS